MSLFDTTAIPTPPDTGTMMLLPPAADRCQECGSKHEPADPHNAQSLYYQVAFHMQHGRAPNWIDAMAHCDEGVRDQWRQGLIRLGVDVDGGAVNPAKKAAARG